MSRRILSIHRDKVSLFEAEEGKRLSCRARQGDLSRVLLLNPARQDMRRELYSRTPRAASLV